MGSPLPPERTEKSRMGKIDGTYVLQSHTNEAAKMAALGLSEEDIRKYVDPKNVIRIAFTETGPECLEIKTTMSNLPDFNNTICLKLGERKELKIPFDWALTMTKKSDNTFDFKTEMNGCVMVEECVFHSYGLSVTGTVGAVSFSEDSFGNGTGRRACVGLCYLRKLQGKPPVPEKKEARRPCIGLCYREKLRALRAAGRK